MMRRISLVPAVLVLTATILAGCSFSSADRAADDGQQANSPSPAASDSNRLQPGPARSGHAVDPADDDEPVPQWDEATKQAAVDTAVRVMELYARPDVAPDEWMDDLRPVATLEFLDDHDTLKTGMLPVADTADTGQLHFDADNGYGCTVTVETNDGPYTVQLLRIDGDRPWKVNAVTPPLGKGTR